MEVGFGPGKRENLKKYNQKNSSKPLYINYYNDNLDDIGEPKIPVTVYRDIQKRWKETYDGLFTNIKKIKENENNINLDDNFYQIYKEVKIDHELKLFNDFKENENLQNKYYKKSVGLSSGTKFKMRKKIL